MRRSTRTSLLAIACLAAGIGSARAGPAAPATAPVPDARPSPPAPVTIGRPVAAKPCLSATRKLEREQSSLATAEADVERYRKLVQGCHNRLTCARYTAALAWLDKRVDRHQRRIERFDTSRRDACKDT